MPFVEATGGSFHSGRSRGLFSCSVYGPDFNFLVTWSPGLSEMASASAGSFICPRDARLPCRSTRGTGELILLAVAAGAVGGSLTGHRRKCHQLMAGRDFSWEP